MADALVVISSYLKGKYSRLGVESGRLHLIPTVIDCRAWACPPEKQNDPPVLLYSGAFSEQDEIGNLLRALALLRDKGREFRLVLLGDNIREPGLVDAARSLIADLAIVDRVAMRGFVPIESVKREICAANILLGIRRDGPWSRSGLSTKLSEYLASGRLVIASTVGETSRYLTSGENALLVSAAASASEIAEAIEKALSSKDFRRGLGQKGQEVARKYFDQPVIAEALQAMLQGVV
jgi:glycosyltransferase involved in cell wall biosynthesis